MTHSSERLPVVKRSMIVYDYISITSIYTQVASFKLTQNSRLHLLTSIKFVISSFSGQLCMNSLQDTPSAFTNNALKFIVSIFLITILCSHNSHSSTILFYKFDHRWKSCAWIRVWASRVANSTLIPFIKGKTFGQKWHYSESIFKLSTVTMEHCQRILSTF